jgi:hypothetical protein
MHRERRKLSLRMLERSEAQSMSFSAAHWCEGAEQSERKAKVIENALNDLRKTPA